MLVLLAELALDFQQLDETDVVSGSSASSAQAPHLLTESV